MNPPQLDYAQLQPTRDYLQDIAKLAGKLQQLFLPTNNHDWHYGLEVCAAGVCTQPFVVKGQTQQLMIDFNLGCVELDKISWELNGRTAQELLQELQYWLQAKGLDQVLETPELITSKPQLDLKQAKALATAFNWAEDQLELIKLSTSDGLTSPVLLYPHHFDLSLVWFPKSDDTQLSLGFSTGDEHIAEPYFYLTAYPQSLPADAWPKPAYWNAQGFEGVVVKYADLLAEPEPGKLLTDLWQSANSLLQ